MLIFSVIVCIISFFLSLCFWGALAKDEPKKDLYALGLYMTSSLTMSILIATAIYTNPIPSAIDVYRGKTELKINKEMVNDSIVKCDSIVVFKDIKK